MVTGQSSPNSVVGGQGGGVLPPKKLKSYIYVIIKMSLLSKLSSRLGKSPAVDLIYKYALSIKHTGLKSTVVSPYSLFSILFPLYVSSSGETHLELGRYLQLNNLDSETAQTVITDTVKLLGDTAFCNYLNVLYMNPSYQVSPTFAELFKSYFKFESGIDSGEIDSFVNRFTNGLIPKIGLQIDRETVAVLLNVIYLKSDWLYKFNKEYTQSAVFRGSDNTLLDVMLMRDTNHYLYSESSDRQVVYLPYTSRDYGMLVVLPKSDSSLSRTDLLDVDIGQMQSRLVTVYLPRFELSVDLDNSYFQNNGLSHIFTPRSEINISDKPFYVSRLLHKVVVKVDENGTEAAALTVTAVSSCAPPSGEPERPVLFRADHTFMFAIIKMVDCTYLPIFTGSLGGAPLPPDPLLRGEERGAQ